MDALILNEGNFIFYHNKIFKLKRHDLNGGSFSPADAIPLLVNQDWLNYLNFEKVNTKFYFDICDDTVLVGQREGYSYIFYLNQTCPVTESELSICLGRINWVHDVQNIVILLTRYAQTK